MMSQPKFDMSAALEDDLDLPDLPLLGPLETIGLGHMGVLHGFAEATDNYSENMDLSTGGTTTPRVIGEGSSVSGSLRAPSSTSLNDSSSQHWQNSFGGSPSMPFGQQALHSLQLALNIARTEEVISNITRERNQFQKEYSKAQLAAQKLMQEKLLLEEKIRNYEVLVERMGMQAFQEAMQTLRDAFDQAPIPRGIRFAPTDVEVFDYLSRKLRGAQEDVGLDRFLVRRLRGVQDSEGLIPEVELLKFPRPWHLPGLDVAPDGKGQVGFYFVRPEWRPNERRRRREADMAARDGKPPCWKESCQPTTFDDLRPGYGGRPERRMFRFKLPGTREGPAGEKKEKWKMYEYTLKSDAEMYEDRRNGLQVWVVCKVVREGPMTADEIEEQNERILGGGGGGGGFPGAGNGNFFGGGLGRGPGMGGQNGTSSSGTGGSSISGLGQSFMGGGGPFGGGGMQHSFRTAAGAQSGEGNAKGSPPSGSKGEEKSRNTASGNSTNGTSEGSGVIKSSSSASRGLLDWLQSVPPPMPVKDRRTGLAVVLEDGSKGGQESELIVNDGISSSSSVSWMARFPDAQKVVGSLLEDFFVSKLVVQLRQEEVSGKGACLEPPSWRRALTEEDWKTEESEEDEELPASEEGEEEEAEGEYEDDDELCRPMEGSALDVLAKSMLAEVKSLSTALSDSSEKEISGRLEGFLSKTSVVLNEFISQAGRDEPAAQLWLESLQDSLRKVRTVIESLAGKAQSRILLLVKSPEMAQEAQMAVRRLAHVLSLLPNVHLDAMSADVRRQLRELKGAMVKENFAPMASTLEAICKLQQALDAGKSGRKGEDEKSLKNWGVGKKELDLSSDDIADLKALNKLKEALLGFPSKTKASSLMGISPVMSSLVVEVFSLVGVQWDSSAVSVELERLGKVTEARGVQKNVVKNVKPEGEDADLAEGVIALLRACSTGVVTDYNSLDIFPDPKVATGKCKDSVDSGIPTPAPLVYSCKLFNRQEIDSVKGERLHDVLSGKLNNFSVSLVFLDRTKVPEIALHREVESVANIRHPNVVSLIGCCPEAACLVYEQLPVVSLEDYLHQSGGSTHRNLGPELPHLPWNARFMICYEIASALAFLHGQKPVQVLHRDVRPANVMIGWDSTNFVATGLWPTSKVLRGSVVSKLAGVGVAAIGREHEPGKTPMDGDGLYLDPSFARSDCFFVPSADVYALGVIMAQLLTGRHPPSAIRAVASTFDGGKKTLVSVLDPKAGDWPMGAAEVFARVAWKCSMLERAARPELKEVLPLLEKAFNCPNCLFLKHIKAESQAEREVILVKNASTVKPTAN